MFKIKIIIKKTKGDVEMVKTEEEIEAAKAAAKAAKVAPKGELSADTIHKAIDVVEVSHAGNLKEVLHKIVDYIGE